MKSLVSCFGIVLLLLFAAGCGKDSPTIATDGSLEGEGGIVFTATRVDDLKQPQGAPQKTASPQTDITPSTYSIAIVNYWLSTATSDVNVLSTTPLSPVFIDFHDTTSVATMHADTTFPAGTYTGYKMQFVYLEMTLPVAFHVPDATWETDYTDPAIFNTVIDRKFRLYFDAIGKYWKRDFVVELVPGSDDWYWMRRGVEDVAGSRNFFIRVSTNTHPPGGPPFESTIDLFDDTAFWGPISGLSSSTPSIIVGTHSTVGGLDCRMDSSFTIPAKLSKLYTIDLEVDITNTMNYWETGTPPTGVTFTPNVLDLGPAYEGGGTPENFGDFGLHPFMPVFNMTASAGILKYVP